MSKTGATRYLYLVSEGPDGPLKVGVSNSPTFRMATFQTGNPRPLRLLATYLFDEKTAFAAEEAFYYEFSHRWRRGEWYDLEEDLALDCMADFFESNGFEVAA